MNTDINQTQREIELYELGYTAGWDMAVDAHNNGQHIAKGGPSLSMGADNNEDV